MTKRRGTHRRREHLPVALLYWLAAGVVAMGVVTHLALLPRERDAAESYEELALAPAAETSIEEAVAELESRPNYRHSVIPGGVYTGQELARAIQRDPLVRDEYGNIVPTAMRAEVLSEPRRAYVSYRVNDRIYWTKNTVALKAGETILSDGETEIRARCGNGISYQPMLPTLDSEPEASELDQLVDADPTGTNDLQVIEGNSGRTPSSSALAAALPGILAGLGAGGGSPGGGGSGGGISSGSPSLGLPIMPQTLDSGEPSGPPSGTPGTPGTPEKPGAPGGPGAPGPGGDGPPHQPQGPNHPGSPEHPVFPNNPDLPDDPSPNDPEFPIDPSDPQTPASVPEPSTLLLLGIGGGVMLSRRLRSRARSSSAP